MLEPNTIDELVEIVRNETRIIPVAGLTKPRLSKINETKHVSISKLSGILQYDPMEFTFTALAGTPMSVVKETLRGKGQYLPFSPVLGANGSTLGGSVASGLAGSGRFRFGSIRDFLLGTRFVDGTGTLITAGGKVVKNAAGFDIPKLMVGSLGRFGILAELTFKVFPAPESTSTLSVSCDSHQQAMERLIQAASSRWELDALDYRPSDRTLFLRIGGPTNSNQALAAEITKKWDQTTLLDNDVAEELWNEIREFAWTTSNSILAKVPITPKKIPVFLEQLDRIDGVVTHIGSGASCAWIAAADSEALENVNRRLHEQELQGLVFCGNSPSLWLGTLPQRTINTAIKTAFDPDHRFPDFNT